jgi:hypothetical protein
MPVVSLPNGTELEFPDGMAESAMRDAIYRNFPEYAPKTASGMRASDAEIDQLAGAQADQDAAAGRVTDTPRRESVLDDTTMPQVGIDTAESVRMSRRAYAEANDPARHQPTQSVRAAQPDAVRPSGEGMVGRAGDLIKAQTYGAAAGLGRMLATGAETVGAEGLADDLNARARAASRIKQRLGQGVELERADRAGDQVEGFAPGSVIQDSKRFADEYLPQILAQGPQYPIAMLGGLAPLVGISYLSSYADARDAGKSPTEALAYAVPQASAEYIGERLGGMGKLSEAFETAVASGFARDAAWRNLGKAFMAAGAREVPSEELTYGLQFINDKFSPAGLQPGATWEDFKKGAADTAIVAMGSGGMLAGAGALVSRGTPPEPKPPIPEDLRPLPVTAPIAVIAPAQTTDEAITAAAEALDMGTQSAEAVANIGRILEQANVSTPTAVPVVDTGAPGSGSPDTAPGLDSGVGADGAGLGPELEPAGPADTPASAAVPPGVADPLATLRDENAALRSQAIQALQAQPRPVVPTEPVQPAGPDGAPQLPAAGPAALETGGVAAPPVGTAQPAPALGLPASMPAETQVSAPPSAPVKGEPIDTEWSAFTPESGTRGVPRADMPQIKAEHRGALTNFLNARGIAHEQVEVPAADLKPTQAEFSPAKVEKAKGFEGGDRSILISSDGHILDGHHQWLAKLDQGETVQAIRLDAPIERLLAEVKEFPSAQTAEGAQGLAPAEDQRAAFAAVESKRVAKAARLRSAAFDKNPLMAFLGKYGVSSQLASEFAPGPTERRKAIVPGYGPVFRRAGMNLDALAERAAEEGYLPPGSRDADALYALIQRAMRGQRVMPQYAEGAVEQQAEAELAARYEDFLENDALAPADLEADIQAVAENLEEAAQIAALLAQAEAQGIDAETVLEEAARITENGTQEAYYATAKQILRDALNQDAAGRRPDTAGRDAGSRQGQQAEPRGGGESRPSAGAPRAEAGAEQGLTAPTRDDVLAQQDRAAQADELDQREQVRRESEAGAGQFSLTQEDGRQDNTGDLFGTPAEETDQAQNSVEDLRKQLREVEDRMVGTAGLAPGFVEDAARSRKVPADMKARREELRQRIRDLQGQVDAARAAPTPQKTVAEMSPADLLRAAADKLERDVTGKPPASWVIREKATGNVVMETFDRKTVDALNTQKYEAVPIGKHLASLSKKPEPKEDPGQEPMFSRANTPEVRDLLVQHNITEENLIHADRMGGLAVPSVAITKVGQPLKNFGEITLIGDKNMADPKAGLKVFGADIYSPRYPNITYKIDGKVAAKINAILDPFQEGGRKIYPGSIDRIDDLTGNKAFQAYVDSTGGKTSRYGELRAAAKKMLEEAGAEERIFQGFTYSGNRRYTPHTLDNVIKILKKEIRGGENFNYGVGSLRAKFTPQFRSIEQIRKAKGNLLDTESFAAVKKEADDELIAISNDLDLSLDQTIEVLEDAPKMGVTKAIARAIKDYKQSDREVDDEVKQRVAQYLTHLRNMPTEYFEGKMLRGVGIGEFKAAVVPEGTGQRALDILEKNNLRVFTYKQGDDADRARAIREAAEETPDALFSRNEPERPYIINPSTVSNVQAAITELLGGKQLVSGLGRVVATTSAEIKSKWEPLIGKNVQIGSEGDAGVAQAFYDPGTKTIFMIADNITAGTETAVLAHELMHKYGQDVLGEAGWNRLHGMIGTWKNAPADSEERQVYDYASAKVQAVGEELSTQELFPYAVEGAIKLGIKPRLQAKRGTVASWLETVRQSLKQVWGRITGKPETFKTQDLVDLAFGIAQMENPETAALRGALVDQTDTPEFKAWFKGSQVVDAQGKPLVVYHSSTFGDFSTFDKSKQAKGMAGYGFYFSDAKGANIYADYGMNFQAQRDWQGNEKKVNIMPVYLNMQNPLVADNIAEVQAKYGKRDPGAFGQGRKYGGMDEAAETAIQRDGYDGVIASEYVKRQRDGSYKVVEPGTKGAIKHPVYVTFEPEQVKSATGNRGTFDPSNPDIRFSRTTTADATDQPRATNSPWRDATGRLQFAPGQWLYDKIGQVTGPLLNWKYLQLKAASPELRRMLRDMKLQVEKAQETAAAVAGEAFKLTDAERAMVSDLVEKEVQAGVQPPAHAVQLAAMINDAMGKQTDELIRLGMLTTETAEKWRGQYLPRYYESKLGKKIQDAWADSIGKMFATPRTAQGIRGKHLKGRGMYQTIPESQLADYEALGWEVRDPDYQPGLATMDGTVQVWRDFTRQERDKMGEIRDAGFRFVMGYMQTQKDIALGRLYEALASNPEMSSRTETEKFSAQVPDTKVPGTGAKTYGKMAGRWVSPETLSQLSKSGEEGNEALMMYRKAMSYWKQGKTSMNPVSHANNVISNVTMAHMAGVSYWRPDAYTGAIKDLVTKAPMVKEAKEAGLFLGSMSETELMNTMPPELRKLAGMQDSALDKAGKTVWDMMTFWLSTPMGKAYQAEDSFFRYLIYRDARGRGLDPADAVDYAQRYIFTYDDLPKGARMIRDFGMPFFAYTYKAIPALLHTALTHPDRLLAPAAVLWTINAAAYAIAAGDDESWDTKLKRYLNDPEFRAKARENEQMERRYLPEWMKGTTALMTPKVIRMGMDEATNLPLFLDMSRMMPGGDLFDVNPNAGGIPLPQPITPNHPFFTLATGLLANKDLFRGNDLTDKNDTSEEKAAKRADWLWKQLSPAIAVNNYHWQRWMNAIAQANGGEVKYVPDMLGGDSTGMGRDGLPVQPKLSALQTVGIKLRPIDLETSELMDLNMQRKMVRDIDAETRSLKRLAGKGAISMKTLETEIEKAAEKKARLREGLTVDGEERN